MIVRNRRKVTHRAQELSNESKIRPALISFFQTHPTTISHRYFTVKHYEIEVNAVSKFVALMILVMKSLSFHHKSSGNK